MLFGVRNLWVQSYKFISILLLNEILNFTNS
jgi:hypothetical protein